MSRRQRLDEVCCAICMDTLFNLRDDLEEVLPVAAPDCGHVFHEKCLLEWFKTQALQYVTNAREHGLQTDRGTTPSPSEAPAECPSCRAECFADPETGEPTIHRLFINFGGEDNFGASSQVGSSPFRATQRPGVSKINAKDREVLGMARRARGLGEEVKALNAESTQEDVEGMLARAGRLKEDVVSDKAIIGLETYLGGLTTALNSLRFCLENNPVIQHLKAQVDTLRREKRMQEQRAQNILRDVVPLEIQRALAAEQAKTARQIRKIQEESDIIQRELEKARVAKKENRKAMEEREREMEKRIADATSQLKREQEDREALQATLRERTKVMRIYQTKADSRKMLKTQLAELQSENARLKANLEQQKTIGSSRRSYQNSPERRSASEAELYDTNDVSADLSIQEIPAASFAAGTSQHMDDSRDDSLLVDMATSADDSSLIMLPPPHVSRPTQPARPGPSKGTARTFTFDLDDPFVLPKKPKLSTTKSQSKYFSHSNRNENQHDDQKYGDSVLVDASSPEQSGPINPFATSREASDTRKALKKPDDIIIDLATSSPERRPLSPFRGNGNRKMEKTRSMAEILGVADAQGRPKKGAVAGVKVKRRA
ncbi:hypothetical protein BCR39DRAFT_521480 [Naematelia encephala]|uniref:RING-type domain-containing protein n=1 Tax=Naematelia encephala TaxID=71784 RepID=A0A1Y2BE98_9TREE|nr:hypothetical protein BCR39DRAFT_521480 [Naematelia encephala]